MVSLILRTPQSAIRICILDAEIPILIQIINRQLGKFGIQVAYRLPQASLKDVQRRIDL
jgi:hypothetical protein